MIDTVDTTDTCEFKIASKVVSMVTLGIDTIDTRDRHDRLPGRRDRRGLHAQGSWRLRRPQPQTRRWPRVIAPSSTCLSCSR
jgi:hypothetical protein